MRPFILESASQFRAPAPPALSSPEYATALNEVKALGGVTSTARTAAQTAIGQFWNANVINQYNQVFRDVASAHGLDLVDTVRLLAMGDGSFPAMPASRAWTPSTTTCSGGR